MREFDFVKETMKKLIYAIEQQQMSAVKNNTLVGNEDIRSSVAASTVATLPNLMNKKS